MVQSKCILAIGVKGGEKDSCVLRVGHAGSVTSEHHHHLLFRNYVMERHTPWHLERGSGQPAIPTKSPILTPFLPGGNQGEVIQRCSLVVKTLSETQQESRSQTRGLCLPLFPVPILRSFIPSFLPVSFPFLPALFLSLSLFHPLVFLFLGTRIIIY